MGKEETQSERIERYARQIRERNLLKNRQAAREWQQRQDPRASVWASMISRCHNPDNVGYAIYGGRGIHVCDRWRDSKESFYEDMGPRPPGMTLERVDVNQGYSPENCVWASRKAQARNKRNTDRKTYLFQRRRMSIHEWSELLEVPTWVLRSRFKARGSFLRLRPIKWEAEVDELLSNYWTLILG